MLQIIRCNRDVWHFDRFLPPPVLANIGGIGGIGNIVPAGCITVDGIVAIDPAANAAVCGQIVSAQLGNCHWLPALGTPPLPQ